ncbi:MAG: UDP-N-acetylmuramoyl-tripeptide--D-alanyl-D-alanine ligase [Gemmatimonadaceae bacterium]
MTTTATAPAPFWTLDRVASALASGGDGAAFPRGDRPLRAVTTDTRAIGAGDLFVALKGERFDAHDFLAEAVRKGAAALVVSRVPAVGSLDVPVYVVPDTLVALGQLARYWRRAWGRIVVGVAGSNGKTTTKDILRAALGSVLDVHATQGNLNNRVGVPLTLLGMPPHVELAVIEIGTNIPGEVGILRAIAEPDVAVITSVAEEHLEGLGDLEGVMREESAIADGTPVVITPAAQPEIAEAVRGRARRVVSAGLEAGDLRADRYGTGEDGRGWIEMGGVTVRLPLLGPHNLRNAMLALAAARELGVPLERAAAGIEAMPQPKMRLASEALGRATVINDAYNANPGSTRAAVELLAATGRGRQRVAVLGTMRELGAHADRLHEEIARQALASDVEVVAGIGDFAPALERAGAGDARVVTASDVDELWPRLRERLTPDAVILLKASRGVALERILPHLQQWAGLEPRPTEAH